METSSVLIFVIAALLAGLAVGWFLGSRPIAEWKTRFEGRDGEARELDEKFRRAITELASASVKAAQLDEQTAQLVAIRHERDTLSPALATAHARIADLEELRGELAQSQAERDAIRGERDSLRPALATADARAAEGELARAELGLIRTDRDDLRAELERLKADAENFAEQKRLLMEAQEMLRKEFENAGSKVLEKAQDAFLARASARFEESEKSSAERLSALLAPVDQRLKSYEEQVGKLEKDRVEGFGQLTGLIQSMRDGQEAVRAAAAQLGNSLRNGPKTRGRWGELQLRNVLEQCGLAEHTDFVTEQSVETAEGRLRPDAIVRVPGNKLLVIDAKVSLNAYQDAFEAEDDDTRKIALTAHVQSMRNHIQTLGAKSYQSQFAEAPDYVLMFVPGEHFIAAALEYDPGLWDYAFERRVLLASPTNLVAIARTIAQVWRQDDLAREAREIGRMGGELYERLAVSAEHLKRMGSGLDSAVSHYNKFVGSFERNVLSAGRRLRDKGIEVGKREIEDVPLVETQPRYAEAGLLPLAASEPLVPDQP